MNPSGLAFAKLGFWPGRGWSGRPRKLALPSCRVRPVHPRRRIQLESMQASKDATLTTTWLALRFLQETVDLPPAAPGRFQSRSEYLIGPNEPQPTDAARAQAATERATLKATASQSQKSRGRWYRIGLLSCDSETIRACRVRSAEMRHLSQMPGIVVNEGLPLPG